MKRSAPNLITLFCMPPMLGILRLRARNLIGFIFIQFVINVSLGLPLLWLLGTISFITRRQ